MSIYKLTFRKIQAAKPKEKPYKIFDGRGLYVLINPNGTKYWMESHGLNRFLEHQTILKMLFLKMVPS